MKGIQIVFLVRKELFTIGQNTCEVWGLLGGFWGVGMVGCFLFFVLHNRVGQKKLFFFSKNI